MEKVIEELRACAATLSRIADTLSKTAESEEPTLTLEEVRAVLAKLSVAGHSAAVKSLIAKFGANKLSDIAPEQYSALLKEAERIGT
jgi:DNA ligase (NAD+)